LVGIFRLLDIAEDCLEARIFNCNVI